MLTISSTRAQSNQERLREQLLSSRKLCLMLDIDRTLLQATNDPAMAPLLGACTREAYQLALGQRARANPYEYKDADKDEFTEFEEYDFVRRFSLNREWYYVKLRPHLKQFLEEGE
jgi:TFIIF-interacting CTD phosphatase-like protein